MRIPISTLEGVSRREFSADPSPFLAYSLNSCFIVFLILFDEATFQSLFNVKII